MTGRWVAAPDWRGALGRVMGLAPGRLVDGSSASDVLEIDGGEVVGLQTPEWAPFVPPQYPQEQSRDDAASPVFDSEPLPAPLDILGAAILRLRLAADAPVAKLAARLTEVTPDGRSWLVTYGVLNLTHRDGHAAPTPLAPGAFNDIELPLYLTARRLRTGSRIRLALSESLWPLLWPSPTRVTLTVDLAGSSLQLPVLASDDASPDFPIPIAPPGRPLTGRGDPDVRRGVTADGMAQFDEVWPLSRTEIAETGTVVERSGVNVALRMRPADPESCQWRASHSVRYARGDWDCRIECRVELAASAEAFELRETVVARRGERRVFEREHRATIPRDLM
jgi:hypothetical protein